MGYIFKQGLSQAGRVPAAGIAEQFAGLEEFLAFVPGHVDQNFKSDHGVSLHRMEWIINGVQDFSFVPYFQDACVWKNRFAPLIVLTYRMGLASL
jgi:hypothetical protein